MTGGTNAGVIKFVGEAINEHMLTTGMSSEQNIVALGIATWGIIDNKEALIASDKVGTYQDGFSGKNITSGSTYV